MTRLIGEYAPEEGAIEDTFVGKDAESPDGGDPGSSSSSNSVVGSQIILSIGFPTASQV